MGRGDDTTRRLHWCSWDKLCKAKSKGGLGFRDFEFFTQSMLAKQDWRLLQNPHSLLGQVLRVKYFPDGTFLKARLGSRPSFAWRSILWGRKLLIIGLRWRIGDGTSGDL